MVTAAVRGREAVAHLRISFEVSEWRACKVLGADRTSVRYGGRRADDATVRARLHELAAISRRFGYRRLLVLMRRERLVMNHKEFRRLYREERLEVRRRVGRKRALGTREQLSIPQGANQRWSLDFQADAFADGQRFRILAVVDDFTRECLSLVADTSLPGPRVVRELEVIIAWRGRPALYVPDNGTELTGMAVLRFSQEKQIEWHYIAPGKPRTLSSRASTPGSATNFSCSPRWRRRVQCSPPGNTITTTPGHIVPWATSHRPNIPIAALLARNGAGRCSMPRAPRPAPLLHRAQWAQMPPGLSPSLDEARGSDQRPINT
jgi:transposase InsO family protein